MTPSACRAAPFGGADAPRWLVYRNVGEEFSPEPEAIHLPADLLEHVAISEPYPVSRLDMNGDRIRDIVVTASSPTGKVFGHGEAPHWLVFPVLGLEILPAIEWSVPDADTRCGYNFLDGDRAWETTYCSGIREPNWRVTDLDGDGIPDLVIHAQSRSSWLLHRGTDKGFGEPVEVRLPERLGWASPSWGPQVRMNLLDFDADGRLDIIDTSGVYDTGAPSWSVYRATADGFEGSPEVYGVPASVSRHGTDSICDCETPTERWMTADLNGDGRPELIVWDLQQPASTWQVWSLE